MMVVVRFFKASETVLIGKKYIQLAQAGRHDSHQPRPLSNMCQRS
jgi:hypothetical protein